MIIGFHHVSFTVSDVQATEAFFTDLMGMTRLGGGNYDFDYISNVTGLPGANLKVSVLGYEPEAGSNSLVLELIEYVHPPGRPGDTATNHSGNAHLCFRVSDLDAEMRRLKDAGVAFKSATPGTVTFGINEGARAIYFNGPDDIALELFEPAPTACNGESSENCMEPVMAKGEKR